MPVKLPVREGSSLAQYVPTAGSTKPSVIDKIPLKLVLMLAAPYIAGKTPTQALQLAHRIYRQEHFTGTLDILGEDAKTVDDCESFVQQYQSLIDLLVSNLLPAETKRGQLTISLKPSMFSIAAPAAGGGSDPKLDDAYERIKKVVAYGKQRNVELTLEAEDHRWTDFQLETYFSLINEGYTNLGTVLQSRLFRTRNDIRRFDERMRVRLVIGIYNEPAEIAHTEKPLMKDVLVQLAGDLLRKGTYVELASHDTTCVAKFLRQAVIPNKISASQFETQFLLGVPRKKLQQALVSGSIFTDWQNELTGSDAEHAAQLAESGVLVRLYLPYGQDNVSGPYCRRRLKANPNMLAYGIKNVLHLE
jgi:proline dehydrogenase